MKRIVLAALIALLLVTPASAQEPWKRGVQVTCTADNIGATLTEMTGCAAPSQSLAFQQFYIGTVVAQSTTTTAGNFTLQAGTGTNCGTGTTNLINGSGTARLGLPANTAAPAVIRFEPPLPVGAGKALCVLGVATNTTSITVRGWLAP